MAQGRMTKDRMTKGRKTKGRMIKRQKRSKGIKKVLKKDKFNNIEHMLLKYYFKESF